MISVSLNSIVGIDNPKTMKMLGIINGMEVVVMIDSGATHNFISIPLVEKLCLPMDKTRKFGVTLGTGEEVKGGECVGE